jgi:amidohydrolase
MVREGVLENPRVDAVFGLHVFPFPVGEVHTRPEGLMASSDRLGITVRGTQTHGAMPWNGVDPIVVAAQIVLGLQTITSRQLELTKSPAIITIGSLHGGVRNNIIPDSVTMLGTIRTFDEGMRTQIHERITRTVDLIARSAGATAETRIERATSVTYNDPKLTSRMLPTLRRIAGADQVKVATPTTTAEDFSAYQAKVPGLFVFLGVTPKGTDHTKAAPNHSPKFFADEAALVPGMRVMAGLAMDYLTAGR